jgi:predicted MFS family arabinose efflux permease
VGDEWKHRLAVAWAASNCFAIPSLQPVILDALVERHGMMLGGAGNALAANLLGGMVGNVVVVVALRHVMVRSLVVAATILLAAVQIVMAFNLQSPGAFIAEMLVAGIAAGVLGAAALATGAVCRDAARLYAVTLLAQIVSGAIAIYAGARIAAHDGLAPLLLWLAGAALVMLPIVAWLPDFGGKRPQIAAAPAAERRAIRLPAALLLASLAALYLSNNAAWAYLERILKTNGLSGEAVGDAIAFGELAACAGALAAAVPRPRSRAGRLMGGACLMAAAILALLAVHGALPATIAIGLIMGALCYVLPQYQSAMAALDGTGSLVAWSQFAVGFGLVAAPPLAAAILEATSTALLIEAAAAVGIIAGVLAIAGDRAAARVTEPPRAGASLAHME